MKLKLYKNIGTILLVLFVGFSCTDNFDEYNQLSKSAIGEENKKIDNNEIKLYLPNMFMNIKSPTYWIYQIAQNLNADIFSGYMMSEANYNDGKNNTNGFMMDGWNNWAFNEAYKNVMKNWKEVADRYDDDSKHIYGVALTMKVFGMHRITDIYGPTPYSTYGQGGVSSSYDSQEAIYERFFNELDTAINHISEFNVAYPGVKPLEKVDLVFKGDYGKWIKFANTLRLRLALRVSKIKPDLAKMQGEKALALGEFIENDVAYDNPLKDNSLIGIAYSYTNIYMGANIESILNGYNDPRVGVYFNPNTIQDSDADVRQPVSQWSGKYVGIRYGIDYGDNHVLRKKVSNLGPNYSMGNVKSTPFSWMSHAEAYFLKAEAGLRDWAGAGNVKENYEKGIETSFEENNLLPKADAYINDATSVPAKHMDILDPSLDIDPVSTITIKWDDGATKEMKLEKIITQKWIANYPNGQEAWSEQRRTGYPKLYPMKVNYSGGVIDNNLLIRRLPFLKDEREKNTAEYDKAVQLLGGLDNPGTRLWWDTEGSNF